MKKIKSFTLNQKNIEEFIKKNNTKYDGKLKNFYNYSRVVSLAYFEKLTEIYELDKFAKVAIVSGSINEPELNLINPKKIKIFSYENDPINCNLDLEWRKFDENEKYDLVLCNQVFEHIFNPNLALSNLKKITKKMDIYNSASYKRNTW